MAIKRPTSKFVLVHCAKCKNEQLVFSKASTLVLCLVCQEPLAQPTSGTAKILGTLV